MPQTYVHTWRNIEYRQCSRRSFADVLLSQSLLVFAYSTLTVAGCFIKRIGNISNILKGSQLINYFGSHIWKSAQCQILYIHLLVIKCSVCSSYVTYKLDDHDMQYMKKEMCFISYLMTRHSYISGGTVGITINGKNECCNKLHMLEI